LPENSISDTAWMTYLTLTQLSSNTELVVLRSSYFPVLQDLMEASGWAAAPYERAECTPLSCILSSESLFAIIDPQNGQLRLFISRSDQEINQWIGPSAQLAVGLSDPSEWQTGMGIFNDPAVIPGAFYIDSPPGASLEITQHGIQMTFPNQSGNAQPITVRYTLFPDGLQVEIHGNEEFTTSIPVLANPLERFSAGWASSGLVNMKMDGNTFHLQNASTQGLDISVENGIITGMNSYRDTLSLLSEPEDPNTGYLPGHYLPFPLVLITVESGGNLKVTMTVH
jgi:hypothetical protein